VFIPEAETWDRVDGWIERGVSGGRRFGVADLPIAGVAAESGLPLWSLHGDLATIATLGFVRAHQVRS
jgi:predicted nucleic acid-binding protein